MSLEILECKRVLGIKAVKLEKSHLTLSLPGTKTAEFANSIDLDEMAHNEPPHQNLHCSPASL